MPNALIAVALLQLSGQQVVPNGNIVENLEEARAIIAQLKAERGLTPEMQQRYAESLQQEANPWRGGRFGVDALPPQHLSQIAGW